MLIRLIKTRRMWVKSIAFSVKPGEPLGADTEDDNRCQLNGNMLKQS